MNTQTINRKKTPPPRKVVRDDIIYHLYYEQAKEYHKKYHYAMEEMLEFCDEWEYITSILPIYARRKKIDLGKVVIKCKE